MVVRFRLLYLWRSFPYVVLVVVWYVPIGYYRFGLGLLSLHFREVIPMIFRYQVWLFLLNGDWPFNLHHGCFFLTSVNRFDSIAIGHLLNANLAIPFLRNSWMRIRVVSYKDRFRFLNICRYWFHIICVINDIKRWVFDVLQRSIELGRQLLEPILCHWRYSWGVIVLFSCLYVLRDNWVREKFSRGLHCGLKS